MKLLLLVWSRIKQYAQMNRLAFTFYLIGSVVCALILIYAYGNTIPAFKIISGSDHLYRSYSIYLDDNDQYDAAKFDSLIESWPFTGIWQEPVILLQKKVDQANLPDIDFGSGQFVTPLIEANYYGPSDLNAVQGRVRFEESDLSADVSPIILPSEIPLINYDNDYFRVGTQTHRIIGRYAGVFSVIIPVEIFAENISSLDIIVVRFATVDNNLQMQNEIYAYLKAYFPNEFIHPPFYMGLDPMETNVISALLAILYGLALSSITFISNYLLEQNRSVDVIYRLVGCSKKQLTQVGLLQNVFFGATTLIISFSLHWLLYIPVFSNLNLGPEIIYTTADYFRITSIILFMTLMLYLLRQRKNELRTEVIF